MDNLLISVAILKKKNEKIRSFIIFLKLIVLLPIVNFKYLILVKVAVSSDLCCIVCVLCYVTCSYQGFVYVIYDTKLNNARW